MEMMGVMGSNCLINDVADTPSSFGITMSCPIQPTSVSTPSEIVPFVSGAAPPNGTNFAHIKNAAYSAAVAKATTKIGSAGCADWLAAETNLVNDADVIPFANQVIKIFGQNARFDDAGQLVPTSIRMLTR